MKKFLTLALALVMALALAAPAMAFVEFEYSVDSKYDLDFYLVDYETGYKVFNNRGVWTDLPAADRGYVTNEQVGAVVSVLVPARNDGGDVSLTVESKNVNISAYDAMAVGSWDAESKLVNGEDYAWDWKDADEWIILEAPAGTDIFETTSNKDFTAAWLVFGRVTADEASLTAKLFNQDWNYNTKLEKPALGLSNSAPYKVGDRKYTVELKSVPNADGTKVGNYVYIITPQTKDGKEVRIYTDADFKTTAMTATTGDPSYGALTGGTKAEHSIAVAEWGAGTTGKFGDVLSLNGKQYKSDTLTTLNDLVAAVAADFAGAWVVTAGTNALTFTAVNEGVVGGSYGPAAPVIDLYWQDGAPAATPPTFAQTTEGKDPTGAALGPVVHYWVGTDGKLYTAVGGGLDTKPTQANTTPVSGVSIGFLNDVLADFNMNPALVKNVLKPEYLGQYRQGNVIEEITIDIQPWQAYVSIPDIEVIDPPKTGDAATLAGFVMIVLAAAGVVVFKKVRA